MPLPSRVTPRMPDDLAALGWYLVHTREPYVYKVAKGKAWDWPAGDLWGLIAKIRIYEWLPKYPGRDTDLPLVQVYIECNACPAMIAVPGQMTCKSSWNGAPGDFNIEPLACPKGWRLRADHHGGPMLIGECPAHSAVPKPKRKHAKQSPDPRQRDRDRVQPRAGKKAARSSPAR